MAVQFQDNLTYLGAKPNFVRDQFKEKKDMDNVNDGEMDDGHISFCVETQKTYRYNKAKKSFEVFETPEIISGGEF